MKRSAALQPLSREHHAALSLTKHCERAAASGNPGQLNESCHRVAEQFSRDLEPHFGVEERELLPMLKAAGHIALVERTLLEHRQLRALHASLLQDCTAGTLDSFARLLGAHVRFEERELFVALEVLL